MPALPATDRSLRRAVLLLVLALALMAGCATSPPSASWTQREAGALCARLAGLGGRVDQGEAALLANAAVEHPIELARQYRAVRPAWFHNALVNGRFRDRGLCYQWANDLFARLNELPVQSMDLHLAVAHMDTRREHNAVVITAHGQPFSQGVVLDAWRHSGRLWWGEVGADKYPWKPLPVDRVNASLRKFVRE